MKTFRLLAFGMALRPVFRTWSFLICSGAALLNAGLAAVSWYAGVRWCLPWLLGSAVFWAFGAWGHWMLDHLLSPRRK